MGFCWVKWFRTFGNAARILARPKKRVVLETLETRNLLAVSTATTPTISGTVFEDANGDGIVDAGEEISGATIQLYLDDGDGVLNIGGGDTQVGSDLTTDANGEYCVDNLDINASYFVLQPQQTVSGLQLDRIESSLITPSDPGFLIDSFITAQTVAANPPAPSSANSTETLANEGVDSERDIVTNLISGPSAASVEVNPFGLSDTLAYNANVGVAGSTTVTWDGVDGDATSNAVGLGGVDLTDGGENTGIILLIGAQVSGSTATIRLYQGNDTNFSDATISIPVTTDGRAESYEFIPFSDFTSTVSPTNVDVIELFMDSSAAGANDIELDIIGANGPKASNFANVPKVDLTIDKTDNQDNAVPGEDLTYTVTANNLGPSDVTGATIIDMFPAQLQNISYTSVATGGATGNTASGSSSINDTVDMPVGSSITYTVNGTVASDATGTLSNSATIAIPTTVSELDPGNNVTVDVDTLNPEADLSITKTDNVTSVVPGESVNYTIVVTNNGPSDVVDAEVVDNFPANLTNVTFTSASTGTVTGNTLSGSGNINDRVSMVSGSTLTYTVTGQVPASATGQLTNTATVNPPSGVQDPDTTNNSSIDTDDIDAQVDLSITKTDNVSTVTHGESLTYVIVASNAGPSDVINATISDVFPSELTGVGYTSVSAGGATGNSTNGSGNISDTVVMPAGSTITYTVTATVEQGVTGSIINTATITAPSDYTETNTSNNSATDTDVIDVQFDLSISKTNGESQVVAGESTSYSIVVANSGPSDILGATVTDVFPNSLTNVSYTSSTSGGASGNTSGNGNINDTVDLPSDSSITYTVTATVDGDATGSLTNTATVSAPAGVTEDNTSNNSSSDTDTIVSEVDLSISKTDNRTTVTQGDTVTYTITVANAGPSDAIGASVTDTLSSELENPSFTSSAQNGASGNTTSGSGDLNETVNLPSGSSITYTVTGTLSETATGSLENTASVIAPSNVTDTDPSNNDATDTDSIQIVLRVISGNVYADSNNDGDRDNGEPPIANVQINLTGVDNTGASVNRTTLTDGNGRYAFEDLLPGTYSLSETQPVGFNDGEETIGTGAVVDPTLADDAFIDLQLGLEQDAIGFDFGEISQRLTKRDLLASSFGS